MQIKTAKTKDCIAATATSKMNNTTNTSNGARCAIEYNPIEPIINQIKPAITLSNVCPAIIFANNRIDKLIGLKKKDKNSIGTSNKLNITEIPEGKKAEKNFSLCFFIESICMPIKQNKLMANVTTSWLVIVKLYGRIPNKLKVKIKKKMEPTIGKKVCLTFD
jgi:hypothetical protein